MPQKERGFSSIILLILVALFIGSLVFIRFYLLNPGLFGMSSKANYDGDIEERMHEIAIQKLEDEKQALQDKIEAEENKERQKKLDEQEYQAKLDRIFSYEPVPETKIDTSDWKIYENKDVGIRFKYPEEYEPLREKIRREGPDEPHLTGVVFSISSNNYAFGLSGVSKDYSYPSDGPVFFGTDGTLNNFYNAFCDPDDVIYCELNEKTINYLNGSACNRMRSPYSREFAIDLPDNNLVGGLHSSYSFLSPEYKSIVSCLSKDAALREKLYDYVATRALDEQSIKNLDTYNAVIDSIEII